MGLEQTLFKRIFRDVVRGHSINYYNNKKIYVKHLGVNEQVDLDDYRLEHLERAKQRGIPEEKEVLKFLKDSGDWTDKDEKDISDQHSFIQSLIDNKAGLYLQSQIDKQDELIHKARFASVFALNPINNTLRFVLVSEVTHKSRTVQV